MCIMHHVVFNALCMLMHYLGINHALLIFTHIKALPNVALLHHTHSEDICLHIRLQWAISLPFVWANYDLASPPNNKLRANNNAKQRRHDLPLYASCQYNWTNTQFTLMVEVKFLPQLLPVAMKLLKTLFVRG